MVECTSLASEEFNQVRVLILLLFHNLSAAAQRSYNITGKPEGVQGLREEQC